ncbi:Syntaxin-binding protein 2 [Rhizophlyctis rosea]|nr:Syntaxin-binding protein 2 [Rhizophlyctis rosea]
MPISLKQLVKNRILVDTIRAVQAGKWKILVVDQRSLLLLQSTCELNEMTEANIMFVEDIQRTRQPYPDKEALYLITPTREAIDALIKDFSGRVPGAGKNSANKSGVMYAAAHIFCIAALPDPLFDRLKASPASSYIRALKELNIDFTPFESQVFQLKDAQYAPMTLQRAPTLQHLDVELDGIADQMISIFSTLSDVPHIRYFDPLQTRSSLSCRFAHALQRSIDRYKEIDPDWPYASTAGEGEGGAGGKKYDETQLVVVDRTLDVCVAAVHTLTYQSAVWDLVGVEEGGKVTLSNGSEEENNTAVLDETDSLFMEIRHLFLADASLKIREALSLLVAENPALKGWSDEQGIAAIQELKKQLTNIPAAKAKMEKISLHVNLYDEVNTSFKQRGLAGVGGVEQVLATGEGPDHEKFDAKKVEADMAGILEDANISVSDKLRLLLTYHAQLPSSNIAPFAEVARLSEEVDVLLRGLKVVLGPAGEGAGLELKEGSERWRYSDFGRKKEDKKKGKKEKKKRNEGEVVGKDGGEEGKEGEEYDLNRFRPVVGSVVKDIITSTLSPTLFPHLLPPPTAEPTHSSSTVETSKKGGPGQVYKFSTEFRPTWGKRKPVVAGMEKEKDLRAAGCRVIVFFVDGVTVPEVRSVVEEGRRGGREVFVGSTHIVTPTQFVEGLMELGRAGVKGLALPSMGEYVVAEKKEKENVMPVAAAAPVAPPPIAPRPVVQPQPVAQPVVAPPPVVPPVAALSIPPRPVVPVAASQPPPIAPRPVKPDVEPEVAAPPPTAEAASRPASTNGDARDVPAPAPVPQSTDPPTTYDKPLPPLPPAQFSQAEYTPPPVIKPAAPVAYQPGAYGAAPKLGGEEEAAPVRPSVAAQGGGLPGAVPKREYVQVAPPGAPQPHAMERSGSSQSVLSTVSAPGGLAGGGGAGDVRPEKKSLFSKGRGASPARREDGSVSPGVGGGGGEVGGGGVSTPLTAPAALQGGTEFPGLSVPPSSHSPAPPVQPPAVTYTQASTEAEGSPDSPTVPYVNPPARGSSAGASSNSSWDNVAAYGHPGRRGGAGLHVVVPDSPTESNGGKSPVGVKPPASPRLVYTQVGLPGATTGTTTPSTPTTSVSGLSRQGAMYGGVGGRSGSSDRLSPVDGGVGRTRPVSMISLDAPALGGGGEFGRASPAPSVGSVGSGGGSAAYGPAGVYGGAGYAPSVGSASGGSPSPVPSSGTPHGYYPHQHGVPPASSSPVVPAAVPATTYQQAYPHHAAAPYAGAPAGAGRPLPERMGSRPQSHVPPPQPGHAWGIQQPGGAGGPPQQQQQAQYSRPVSGMPPYQTPHPTSTYTTPSYQAPTTHPASTYATPSYPTTAVPRPPVPASVAPPQPHPSAYPQYNPVPTTQQPHYTQQPYTAATPAHPQPHHHPQQPYVSQAQQAAQRIAYTGGNYNRPAQVSHPYHQAQPVPHQAPPHAQPMPPQPQPAYPRPPVPPHPHSHAQPHTQPPYPGSAYPGAAATPPGTPPAGYRPPYPGAPHYGRPAPPGAYPQQPPQYGVPPGARPPVPPYPGAVPPGGNQGRYYQQPLPGSGAANGGGGGMGGLPTPPGGREYKVPGRGTYRG